jgi:WD40 repeat protein
MIHVKRLHQLFGHKDSLYTLAKLPQPNQFLSAGADGYVVVWNLDNYIPESNQDEQSQATKNQDIIGKVIAKIANSVYAMCVIAEKNYVVIGHNTDGIHIIDLTTKQEIFSAGFTKAAIFDIKNIANDLWVACGDGNIVIIDLETFTLKKILTHSTQAVRSLSFCEQTQEIAAGYSDGNIRIFDTQHYQIKHNIIAHQNSVFTVCYSPDGSLLVSGSRDAHLKLWQTKQDYVLQQDLVAHLFTINHITYSPDNQYFATCSKDKSIKLWQAHDNRLVKVIDKGRHAGHGTSINKLLWLDNHTLVSCSDDNTLVVWQILVD